MGDKRLDVWAEEGGVMLKLTRPDEHHIAIEIINPNAGDPSRDRVIARATMASFRWQRIADYFDRERDERIRKLEGMLQEYIYHACSSCGHPGLRDDIADRARKLLGEG